MKTTPETRNPSPPERIRDLAHKLKRLANDRAAPPAEKDAARAKLISLLRNNGLTLDDIFGHEVVPIVMKTESRCGWYP